MDHINYSTKRLMHTMFILTIDYALGVESLKKIYLTHHHDIDTWFDLHDARHITQALSDDYDWRLW